jgi:hypothetical protein
MTRAKATVRCVSAGLVTGRALLTGVDEIGRLDGGALDGRAWR